MSGREPTLPGGSGRLGGSRAAPHRPAHDVAAREAPCPTASKSATARSITRPTRPVTKRDLAHGARPRALLPGEPIATAVATRGTRERVVRSRHEQRRGEGGGQLRGPLRPARAPCRADRPRHALRESAPCDPACGGGFRARQRLGAAVRPRSRWARRLAHRGRARAPPRTRRARARSRGLSARAHAGSATSPYFDLAPDWICEVLSPSTARLDRGPKREVDAREHVPHLWFVDPDAKTLEVLRLDGTTYRVVQTFADDAVVRAEPFDAVELELAFLWVK